MKPKYKLKSTLGFRAKGVDVNKLGDELAALDRAGALTAERALEAAEDPDCELHKTVEWDRDVAAREHQLAQMRSVIRAVVIVGGPDERPTNAYYRIVNRDNQASYQRTARVVSSQAMLESALDLLRAELESAQRSLQDLEAAAQKYRSKPLAAKAARVRMPLNEAAKAARR